MTDSSVTSSTQTVSRGSGPRRWLLLLLGLVVAGFGWTAARSGDGNAAGNEAGNAEEESGQTTDQTLPPDDQVETESVTEEPPVTAQSTAAQSATAQPDERVDPFDATARVELIDGPVVGSGLTLVFGSPLRFVDLETGEAVETSLPNRLPVSRVGDLLILANLNSGGLESIDLQDLSAPPVGIGIGEVGPRAVVQGEAPGTLEVVGYDIQADGGERRYLYDAATGAVLESFEVDTAVEFGNQFGLAEFFSPPTGGVYRADGDGASLVTPGRLLAQGAGLLLVQACDQTLECRTQWLRADSLAPVSRVVPDDIRSGQVLAGGRLLAYEPTNDVRLDLIDLETGALVLADYGNPGTAIHGISVSPDNRFVAFARQSRTFVLELETGTEFEIGTADSVGPGPLLIETALRAE